MGDLLALYSTSYQTCAADTDCGQGVRRFLSQAPSKCQTTGYTSVCVGPMQNIVCIVPSKMIAHGRGNIFKSKAVIGNLVFRPVECLMRWRASFMYARLAQNA